MDAITEGKTLFDKEEEFKRAVETANGEIVILVHPYFEQRHNVEEQGYKRSRLDEKRLARYKAARKRLLENSSRPVVIFEEHTHVDEALEGGMGRHFIVPTEEKKPNPTVGWDDLHKLLTRAGVKKIYIGGMYSWNALMPRGDGPNYKQKRAIRINELMRPGITLLPVVKGCVGFTYAHFARKRQKGMYDRVELAKEILYPHRPCHVLSFRIAPRLA